MDILGLLSEILRFFWEWIPRPQKVLTTELAVRYRTVGWGLAWTSWWWTHAGWLNLSPAPEEIGPGWYWVWPVVSTIQVEPANERCEDVPQRPALTQDGVSVVVDGVVTWRFADGLKALLRCESIEGRIESLAIVEYRAAVNGLALADLIEQLASRAIDRQLAESLQGCLRKFGIRVLDASVSLGRSRPIHLTGLPKED